MADLTPEQKEEDKKTEDWMTKKWRPMMAMMYMSVCAFDFIVAPILWAIVQFWETSAANDAFRQWSPLTLQGAGLFHMAMGAVLGITAWSRGQEKLAGVADAKSALPSLGSTPTPAFGSVPLGGNSVSTAPSFSAPVQTPSFSAPAPSVGFGGKLAPPPAPQPEL
jgi:hypothetical protein